MNIKNYLLLIVLSILCLFSLNTYAQPTETAIDSTQEKTTVLLGEKSLLWEISGNGLEKPSFLYGTIHLIEKKDFFLTDATKKAFEESEQVAFEIDMDDPSLVFSMLLGINMKGGTKLKDLLTEQEYTRVKSYFQDSLGMQMFMLERMKPMLISSMVSEQMSIGETVSYEQEFMKMAKVKKFNVVGLETAAYQMSVFDSIPYKDQAKMLVESLDAEGDLGEKSFNKMVELYKDQDLDNLYAMIAKESAGIANFNRFLLTNRNKNWIPVIGELAKDKVTFIAVGAGHLAGEMGVINLLREEGYTVKAMF